MIGGVFREGQMKGGVVANLVPFTWTLTCYIVFNFNLTSSHLHEPYMLLEVMKSLIDLIEYCHQY